MFHGKGGHVDIVQAADVHGAHFFAVSARSTGEGWDATHTAEEVVDVLLAELIVGERV
jgi:hypothetical protein